MYENWRASIAGASSQKGYEYPLFTDAEVIGEVVSGLGPHQILNCIAEKNRPTPTRAALALRIDVSDSLAPSSAIDPSEYGRYHGGDDTDEVAALLSLCLGFRLKAGSATRLFDAQRDPRGRPWTFSDRGLGDPAVTLSSHGATIPRLRLGADLTQLPPPLFQFASLTPPQSIDVIRAARLYQEAVWVAESEPWLTWLLFVAALECGAQEWNRGRKVSPRERMRTANPALEQLLVEHGNGELADRVADHVAVGMKSTQKFLDFVMHFMPGPPAIRPPERFQLAWDPNVLRPAVSLIYSYRSGALHGGKPFPWPMSWQPRMFGVDYAERTFASAGGRGGLWKPDEIPMMLHVFEHITRNVLLAWWGSMTRSSS